MSTWRESGGWPDVDVVMPVRNEATHLPAAVAAVRSQEYPGRVRIFLGVGPSTDGTEAAAEALAGDDLVVVPNPSGVTPSGLNVAIRAGRAPVVVRVDGHSELSPGYVRRAVETLRSTGAVNVGGRQVPVPTTPFEEAVAAATTSWLGTGGASYRVGGEPGPVDTVFLGVFDRAATEAVGLFDERLVRNQDYELNIRLRRAGGTVWFDPELWVGYRPRGSWSALARQYFEYGYWKAAVLRMHPGSARLRQLVPPLAVVGVLSGLVGGVFRRRMLVVPAVYAVAVSAAARTAAGRSAAGRDAAGHDAAGRGAWRATGALVVIHSTWAAGLLRGLPTGAGRVAGKAGDRVHGAPRRDPYGNL